jgi:hypothetical protein
MYTVTLRYVSAVLTTVAPALRSAASMELSLNENDYDERTSS